MNRRRLMLLLGCLILLLCGHATAQPATDSGESTGEAGEAQILVMLRLPPKHFHSDGSYGAGWDVQSGKRARWRIAEKLAQGLKLRVIDNWAMSAIGVDCFVMQIPAGQSPDGVVRQLAAAPEVESAQVVNTFHTLQAARDPSSRTTLSPATLPQHNDPLFLQQPTSETWHLAELHRSATGRGVTIAVIDSGIDLQHADLRGQVRVARNFVTSGNAVPEAHGTAVAGIIAARADDGIGIAGVAPGARLLALRACWEAGRAGEAAQCNTFMLAKALHFAIDEEADIINMSLSGPPDTLLARLLNVALARGATVVAALAPPGTAQDFPASHPGVIAVGMTGRHSDLRGVNAPGRDVPATLPGGQWGLVSGASFSAAEVSGLIALLRELSGPLQPGPFLVAPGAGLHHASEQGEDRSLDSCALARHAARHCVCQCSKDADSARTPWPGT